MVKNGRKLNFNDNAMDDNSKKDFEKPKEICQQSEGDIIELTQSAKKRR